MEAGEKEMRKAFEETTTRNVAAVVKHSNETRELVRHLEEKIKNNDNLIRQYDAKFEAITKQLAALQTKIYAGGSSGIND